MIRRLQRKFIGIVMLALALVIVILLGSINLLKYSNTANRADQMLQYLSENKGRFPDEKKPPGKGKPPGINADTGYKTRFFFVWLDQRGNVIRVNTGHIAAVSSEEAVVYGQRMVRSGKSGGYLDHYRYGTFPNSEHSGSMIIFLDCSTEQTSDQFFLLLSCTIGFAAFAVVSCVTALFSRRAIQPIEEAMEKQRQFLEDAEHELKTPLAIISANNDVLELTAGKSAWSDSIRNQVSRMDGLLQSMLAMTKLDAQRPDMQMERLNLSLLVSQAAEPFYVLAETSQVSLSVQVASEVYILGDAASLQQLVSILLENAVKYAGPNGAVVVQLEKRGRFTCLWVENTCSELPSGNLNRLFDRFYRADTSRSRETGGYGIGLSIAKSICQTHHANISVETVEPNAIRFTISFG